MKLPHRRQLQETVWPLAGLARLEARGGPVLIFCLYIHCLVTFRLWRSTLSTQIVSYTDIYKV